MSKVILELAEYFRIKYASDFSSIDNIILAIDELGSQYRSKLLPIWKLREHIGNQYSKSELDTVLLYLAEQGRIQLIAANDPQSPDILEHGVDSGIDQRPKFVNGKRTEGRGILWFVRT